MEQWVDDVVVVAAAAVADKVDDEVDDTAFHCPWLDKVVFVDT